MKVGSRAAWATAAACVGGAGLAACHPASATGQVLATVGGKDITLQDVRAEGRANGVSPSAGHAAEVALLQRVVDRTLLAQSAHAQKLDQTPEAPSDLARLEQGWRADKAAKRLLAGLTPPTDAAARAFIAEHPYAFAKRQRIAARTITLATSPTLLSQLKTYSNFDAALAFLRRLGVAMKVGEGQVDTAQLGTNAAERLVATPDGALITTQPPGEIQLAEIKSHAPVATDPAQQLDAAKKAVVTESAQRRVTDELKRLKASTPVIYQNGYAPSSPAVLSPGAPVPSAP